MKVQILSLLLLASASAFGQQAASTKKPPDTVPLDQVIAQVQQALDEYQGNLGTGDYKLPPLATAEFDFKATTATTDRVPKLIWFME